MADEAPNVEEPTPAEPESEAAEQPESEVPAHEGSAEQAATDAIEKAEEAAQSIAAETAAETAVETAAEPHGAEAVQLPDFAPPEQDPERAAATLGLLHDVELNVKIELGRTRMYVEDVLRLNENSVIELDKAAGDPVDIFVNDRHVARGEVLVLNENFCVRISEIIQPAKPGEKKNPG
ncbi:MAG: flagellar motor switch protein FliN [Planctomycetes bacterium]|nr:flagellar motor switch protein FliN [Planctomycetota bacterium]